MNPPPHRGFTVWFTGLPSSGKTTLAHHLLRSLQPSVGDAIEVLDGDVVRTHLSKGLGFSKEDRDTNIRRIGWVCRILTKHHVAAVAAAISPYREARTEVRRMVEDVGGQGSFVEVYLQCPIEVCEQRDTKGLYAQARNGKITHFTGVSDPYEPPLSPEVVVDTDTETPAESSNKILSHLRASKLI